MPPSASPDSLAGQARRFKRYPADAMQAEAQARGLFLWARA